MTQPTLFTQPADPATLSDKQAAIYEAVLNGARTPREIGQAAGLPDQWAATDAKAVLRRLKQLGLVRWRRNPTRWEPMAGTLGELPEGF